MTGRQRQCGTTALRQRGAAVILAMLVVLMAALLAAYMARQQDLWQREVEARFQWVQARKVGMAAVDWARAVLADDAAANHFDYPGEMWTKQLPAATVEQGKVVGRIVDQQGLFNLNNLVRNGATSPADMARFRRLLVLIDLPPDLADSLADWMDADGVVQGAGAEDAYYLALPHPYRAANRPLVELDELRLVKGFNADTVRRLRPFVSVLPGYAPINVNFAPPEVLAAVIDGLPISMARQVAQGRAEHPFASLPDFNSRLPLHLRAVDGVATVSSSFFMVKGYTKFGQSQVVMEALLQRTGTKSTVIWQSIE